MSISDALGAAFGDKPLPSWDGETLVLDPIVRYADCRTWDDYVALGRVGGTNVSMMMARADYRQAWVAAYDVAHHLGAGDPDLVDAVLDAVSGVDEQAAMFAVWVAGVPQRYRSATLGDFDFEIAERVRAWIAQRVQRPSLVLAGPTGTGKTRMGYAIARHLFVDRTVSSWQVIPMPMLLSTLRPGGEADAFEHLSTLDLLVLDDVGAERPTDWTVEQVDALVDLRWRHGLATIVTTNMQGPAFREHVGDRVHSRLVVDGTAITLTGVDRRGDHDDDDAFAGGDVLPKPGEACRRCEHGLITAPRSYVEREGHAAVYPCPRCRPQQNRVWTEGGMKLRGGSPERTRAHRAANAAPEPAPLPLDAPSDVPKPQPTPTAVPLPYKDDD